MHRTRYKRRAMRRVEVPEIIQRMYALICLQVFASFFFDK